MANARNAAPVSSRPNPSGSSFETPSMRRKPSRYSPANANSTTQAARKRSRVRIFHCSTWSTDAHYFSIAASTTKPIMTFTRGSHPPLRGKRFRNPGNMASRKNGVAQTGRERRHAHQRTRAAVLRGRRQQRSHERTHAGERRQAESQPHQQRSQNPASLRSAVELGQQARRQRDFKSAQQAQSENQKYHAMNPFTHGFDPSCTTPNGPSSVVVRKPIAENSTMIPRQNTAPGTRHRAAARLLVQEERHRDRNHREHARREDREQPGAKRQQQKRAGSLRLGLHRRGRFRRKSHRSARLEFGEARRNHASSGRRYGPCAALRRDLARRFGRFHRGWCGERRRSWRERKPHSQRNGRGPLVFPRQIHTL